MYASSFKHRRIQASKEATSYADSVDTLRKANKDKYAHVLEICRTRVQLSSTSIIIVKIIDAIADGNKIHNMMGTNVTNLREGRQKQTIVGGAKSLSDAVPCFIEIGSMGGNSIYNIVGFRARNILYTKELIVQRKDGISSSWTMQDYSNNDVTLAQIQTNAILQWESRCKLLEERLIDERKHLNDNVGELSEVLKLKDLSLHYLEEQIMPRYLD